MVYVTLAKILSLEINNNLVCAQLRERKRIVVMNFLSYNLSCLSFYLTAYCSLFFFLFCNYRSTVKEWFIVRIKIVIYRRSGFYVYKKNKKKLGNDYTYMNMFSNIISNQDSYLREKNIYHIIHLWFTFPTQCLFFFFNSFFFPSVKCHNISHWLTLRKTVTKLTNI